MNTSNLLEEVNKLLDSCNHEEILSITVKEDKAIVRTRCEKYHLTTTFKYTYDKSTDMWWRDRKELN